MVVEAMQCAYVLFIYSYVLYTVWTLIFAVLNFRGFRGSTAICESFVPRKFRPAAYWAADDVHFDGQ